jgi:hypothetical protein
MHGPATEGCAGSASDRRGMHGSATDGCAGSAAERRGVYGSASDRWGMPGPAPEADVLGKRR